ncbi:hypothetical protein F4813DRAFT_392135 [Daldinia decipiens]|uniref:uncharacterized protein n=1 Tax=Daldinia decipiens TaxID=326647 RepID=UPI0020C37C78|nr:uncharacterized protein F4813DRAFT_392135 [Daldinia decipiens]KAI1654880.1 hypothetical protein F4813DRAFT_392135 [Daldinia decipiens]
MCKQYHYHTKCHTTNCQSILGSKKRNRYCREALKARRLGRCSTGVQIAGVFRSEDSKACCDACKQQAKIARQREQENEQQVPDQSSSDQENNSDTEILSSLGFVAMPKAKPKPPSQPLVSAQPKPLPKSKANNSNKDLFDTNAPREVLAPQTPEKKTSATSSSTTKRGRRLYNKPQDHDRDHPPVDDAERYPYGFGPTPTEGKYVYEYKREDDEPGEDGYRGE